MIEPSTTPRAAAQREAAGLPAASMPPRTFSSRAARATGAVVVFAFLVGTGFLIVKSSFVARDGHRYFTINDDALVSLRYAWNLGHGHGLCWNPGEQVEGFTNPLWTLYAAVWSVVLPRHILPLAMQVSGVLLLLGQAIASAGVVRAVRSKRGKSPPWMETAALALPLVYYPLVYWSVQGLEVCLVGFLATLAVLFYVRKQLTAAAVVLGLAFWTRHDTAIPAAVIMTIAVITAYREQGRAREWIKACCVLAGMVIAVFAARQIYYHHAWPNTFVLRMEHFPLADRIRLNALGYITPYLSENALPLGLALTAVALQRTWLRVMLAATVVSMIAYSVYVGGDPQPHWRFVTPYTPFLGLVLLTAEREQSRWQSPTLRRVVLVTAVGAMLLTWVSAGIGPMRTLATEPDAIYRQNVEIARLLNRWLEPEATIGVVHAGAIPYYTDFRAVDFLGKCDKLIARLHPDVTETAPSWQGMRSVSGHNKYDLNYSIGILRPTYIQTCWWGGMRVAPADLSEWYLPVRVGFMTCFTDKSILLLKGSPLVRWDRISAEGRQ